MERQLQIAYCKGIRKYLTIAKTKLPGTAFVESQLNYALLISMFCQNTLYLKIEKIHHKKLRIIHESNFFCHDFPECNDYCNHQIHVALIQRKRSSINSKKVYSAFPPICKVRKTRDKIYISS